MKCIVGLGNPGTRYANTRHNIGFRTVEFLIGAFNARGARSSELYESFQCRIGEQDIALLMPQTFMNNSGEAVLDFMQSFDIAFDDILIVYDDFQLPFGTLRIRPEGSDGGHNGMSSVIEQLQNDMVPRLRFGVGGSSLPGHHTNEMMAEYVLSSFDAEETKLLPVMIRYAHDACVSWIGSGIQRTMSRYNRNFFTSADA